MLLHVLGARARGALPTLRFYARLLATSLSASLALRASFLVRMSFMALNNLIFFVFWWLLLERVGDVRGYGLPQMARLFGVAAAAYGLANVLAGGAHELSRLIRDGGLDSLLTQPKPTLPYVWGLRSNASGVGDVASGLWLVFWPGQLGLAELPIVLVCVAASALVVVATISLAHGAAFFLSSSEGLSRSLVEVVITFSVYPDRLFTGGVRVVLFTVLPSAFFAYVPAEVVAAPSLSGLATLLSASAVYTLLAAGVFRLGLRRYASGSRFGGLG